MATLYRDFKGPVTCVFGTGDTQVDVGRQRRAAEAAGMGGRFGMVVLEGLGHGLGVHGLAGPMADEGIQAVVRAAAGLLA